MLGQVDDLTYLNFAWGLHVDGHIFVADFGCKLCVVNFSVFAALAPALEVLQLLAHFLFIIKLAIELLAFVLSRTC